MQGDLILLLAAHLVMTALPGIAAALCAARSGVTRVPVLLAIGMAATGAAAMLAFWAYYADHTLGQSFSFFVLFGSVLLAGWSLWGGRIDPGLLRALATPLALWALGASFLVFFGFLHGGADRGIEVATIRFSHGLPTDNDLPHYFTEWFYANDHTGRPVYPPDWLASDRPPLQIGYMLMQRPLAFSIEGLNYQVAGVILQQLWIVGLWALLLAARVGWKTRALAMLTVLVSDLALLNGFYVWPKLLPAAMLVAAAALMITPLWNELKRSPWAGALIGVLLGLAMMGHGSSIFGVIPLLIVAAIRGLPSWRWLGAAALAGIVLMAPWSAYQKYGEPPGNRLVKYSLAGVPEITGRGTLESIVDAYREAGIGGALHNKGQNFVTMAGGGPAWEALDRAAEDLGSGDLSEAIGEVRTVFFFDLFPAFGLLLIAPLVMLAGRRRARDHPEEWSFALACFAVVAIGAFAWGMLSFGNLASRTVLHVCSYLLPVLGFAGGVAGLRAVYPRFAVVYVSIAATLMFALYVPSLDSIPGTSYSALNAVLAAACLAGFAAVVLRPERSSPLPDAPSPAPHPVSV